MAFHHVALATNDLDATHRFYTDVMGFTLVKTVAASTGAPDGAWTKHLFYDTGGDGLLAVWDLHDDNIADFNPAISTGLGLPEWVNHIAFCAASIDDLERRCRRWQEHGITVVDLDHGWCRSIYATDPNGILVEFCCTTAEFTPADHTEAELLLGSTRPELEALPEPVFHEALEADAVR